MSSVEGNTLPDGWDLKPLGEIVKLQNGFAFKRSLYKDKGYPIVRIKNIKNERVKLDDVVCFNPTDYNKDLDQYKIEENDILIAMSGATTGKIGLYKRKDVSYLNQRVGLFRIKNGDLRRYLLYFLSTQVEENLLKSLGAAQPNLSSSQINEMETPIPPLEEQKRIVAKIDTLFAKIDKAITLTEESLKQAKNLLPSVLKEVFEKGKADGWEEKKLGEVFKLTSGKFLPKRKLINGKHKVYGGNGITALHNDYFIEDETIVIGRVGEYCGATHIVDKKSWVTDNGLYCKEFFLDVNLGFLKSILTNMNLNQYAKTSGQPSISQTTVHNLSVPIPSIKRQKEIENYFASMDKLNEQSKSKLKEQLRYLKQLKSSILSKAFKGEL